MLGSQAPPPSAADMQFFRAGSLPTVIMWLPEHACQVVAAWALVGDQSALMTHGRDREHLFHRGFASRTGHPAASVRKV